VKLLFVSFDGLIADIAWQVVREGHEARFWIKDPEEKEIADGFVPKTDDWRCEVDWAEVVVFDDVLGMGAWAHELRQAGKKVVGGSPYTDRLEDDRAFGQQELKAAGVTIIPQQDFTAFDDAIAFVKANSNRYVIKPSGEAQNYKRLLFVGEEEDGRDVVQVLEDYKRAWSNRIREFQLQRRIMGVEVATGAFFNGREFVSPICVNFEHKRLFPGDIGPSTGEMGTAMFWSEPNKIFNATLKKMEPKLREEGYSGYIDINCIVNSGLHSWGYLRE
jgi:phosphoribosylamine--glycine ligase